MDYLWIPIVEKIEIQDGGRPPSWISENLISDHCVALGCLVSICTKFGAKMLIDAEIMARNRNSRWRPSAILEFLYHHIGPPTKSFPWSTLAYEILC